MWTWRCLVFYWAGKLDRQLTQHRKDMESPAEVCLETGSGCCDRACFQSVFGCCSVSRRCQFNLRPASGLLEHPANPRTQQAKLCDVLKVYRDRTAVTGPHIAPTLSSLHLEFFDWFPGVAWIWEWENPALISGARRDNMPLRETRGLRRSMAGCHGGEVYDCGREVYGCGV